jgi:hypothetical protein
VLVARSVNVKCSTVIGEGTRIGQESLTGKFGGINTVITASTIGMLAFSNWWIHSFVLQYRFSVFI